jgi:hypothetical protein
MIALLLLLLAAPAAAQAPGCGFGLGLEALRAAEPRLAAGPRAESLTTARNQAAAAASQLTAAETRFAECRCPRLAEQVGEARQVAELAATAASFDRAAMLLDRAGQVLGEARQRIGRQGCS